MPTVARFTARDPLPGSDEVIVLAKQPEYCYSTNRPVLLTDPTGMRPDDDYTFDTQAPSDSDDERCKKPKKQCIYDITKISLKQQDKFPCKFKANTKKVCDAECSWKIFCDKTYKYEETNNGVVTCLVEGKLSGCDKC